MGQEKLGVADSLAFGQIFGRYLQNAALLYLGLGGFAFTQKEYPLSAKHARG